MTVAASERQVFNKEVGAMSPDKSIKKAKENLIISSIILCITGLIFMIFSETMVNLIGWILGSVLFIIGVVKLIGYIRTQLQISELIISIISIAAGVLLFLHPGWVMSLLSVIIGIYVLIEGALKIKISIDAKKQEAGSWWVLLVVALVSIGIGILLVFNPFGISKAFMFVVGLALLLSGAQNIIHAIYTEKVLNEMNQDIIDMDEYMENNK